MPAYVVAASTNLENLEPLEFHAAARRPGAPSAVTSDPLPWRARTPPKLRSEFIPSTSEPATET